MKTLLGDPVEDFVAYESYDRFDAHVWDESFLNVHLDRLHVNLERHLAPCP